MSFLNKKLPSWNHHKNFNSSKNFFFSFLVKKISFYTVKIFPSEKITSVKFSSQKKKQNFKNLLTKKKFLAKNLTIKKIQSLKISVKKSDLNKIPTITKKKYIIF